MRPVGADAASNALIAERACSSSDTLRSVTSLPSAVRTVSSPDAIAESIADKSFCVNAMRQGCRRACAIQSKRLHDFRSDR